MLEKETKTDKLTGLYNRAAFHEFLNVLTNEESKIHFQLALFDLDNFKNINDTYGHRVGDTVLQRVSDCIRNAILPDDVAARIGGEEFAIILTGKSIEESFRFLERLRTSIAEMNVVELSGNPITISAGLQQYDGKMSKENLFELADVSLYKAKRSGKNNIIINFLSDLCELTETVNR